jgi:hypothetical protein
MSLKPGIERLLIDSALQPDLRRRLLDSPEEVFEHFELTDEQKDILRRPDHRLFGLLGAALARQEEPAGCPAESSAQPPRAALQASALPDLTLVLTVAPYVQRDSGQLAYAAWVNPLAEGADPNHLPPPAGGALPGQALAPMHAVIHISALQIQDQAGHAQVGLTAWLRHSSNMSAPAPAESAGKPAVSPFASDLRAAHVKAAVAAVRNSPASERYGRLIDLLHRLQSGDVR